MPGSVERAQSVTLLTAYERHHPRTTVMGPQSSKVVRLSVAFGQVSVSLYAATHQRTLEATLMGHARSPRSSFELR